MTELASRIIEGWDEDALRAVWDRAQQKGDIKNLEAAIQLQLSRANGLSLADADACFQIVKHTSHEAYKKASIGWRPSSKRKEMLDSSMTYLMIRTGNDNDHGFAPTLQTDILAFTSFKIEYDDPPYEKRSIIYVYEVHVGEELRGRGLGKYMLWCIEAMADTNEIFKIMLTVFKSNESAIAAYRKLGYVQDEASPPDRRVRGRIIKADYMIMSKFWGKCEG